MKSFDEKSAVGPMLRAGTRTIGMGSGHPKTRPLLGDFRKKQTGLKKAQLANNDADDALIEALAECDLQRELANETIDGFQITLEGVVSKNWKDPLYTGAFPKGLTAFKDQDSVTYEAALRGLIDTIKDSGEPALKKYLPALRKHVNAFEEPLVQLRKAQSSAKSADLKLRKAKIAWLDAYAALEGSFNATFPRRRRFVASFFPQSSGPSGKKGGSGGTPPGGGGPAPVPADGDEEPSA